MTEATTLPRTEQVVGTWAIDGSHSVAGFSAKHMMISTIRGRFDEFDGAITLADDPTKSSVEAKFKTASLSTNSTDRDTHLRSPDFLDVENYPEMTFKSTEVRMNSDSTAEVAGDLTIRGVTKPVTLDVAFVDFIQKDLWGKTRASFTATTSISRKEWGLTWNMALETGGVVVGDKVDIVLDITAVKE